jgi:branched-chain amino acid transport system ATP-binding protein
VAMTKLSRWLRLAGGLEPSAPGSGSSSAPAGLHVRGLNVYYGRMRIVQDVELSLDPGVATALIGRNGVGKTTLLRGVSASFGARAEGSIIMDGREIVGLSSGQIARAGLGTVCSDRRILPLTVRENLLLGYRGPSGAWSSAAERASRYFPAIMERLSQAGDTLSGGEQQALAIARALMASPRYLLLDEPAEGLAPAIRRRLAEALREMAADHVVESMLIVDRDIDFLSRDCSRVLVMNRGAIIYSGDMSDLAQSKELQIRFLGLSRQDEVSDVVGD